MIDVAPQVARVAGTTRSFQVFFSSYIPKCAKNRSVGLLRSPKVLSQIDLQSNNDVRHMSVLEYDSFPKKCRGCSTTVSCGLYLISLHSLILLNDAAKNTSLRAQSGPEFLP